MRDCFSPHEKDEESKKLESKKKTREEESEHISPLDPLSPNILLHAHF